MRYAEVYCAPGHEEKLKLELAMAGTSRVRFEVQEATGYAPVACAEIKLWGDEYDKFVKAVCALNEFPPFRMDSVDEDHEGHTSVVHDGKECFVVDTNPDYEPTARIFLKDGKVVVCPEALRVGTEFLEAADRTGIFRKETPDADPA